MVWNRKVDRFVCDKVPYAKIVSFKSYSDGIGIQRDAANAKFQSFVTGDGWFTYNLLTNLSHLSA